MFLYTSSNIFELLCGIILNMSANIIYIISGFSSPTLFIIIITGYSLSSMVKAYSLGTFICHTNNILTCKFEIVQWIKPPLTYISNFVIPHRHMNYNYLHPFPF